MRDVFDGDLAGRETASRFATDGKFAEVSRAKFRLGYRCAAARISAPSFSISTPSFPRKRESRRLQPSPRSQIAKLAPAPLLAFNSRERAMSARPDFGTCPRLTLARTARWERIAQAPQPADVRRVDRNAAGGFCRVGYWGLASIQLALSVQNTQRRINRYGVTPRR